MTRPSKALATSFSVLCLLTASIAAATPKIEISLTLAKEVPTKPGAKTTKLIPTTSATPGDIVHYTVSYVNKGDEKATNAKIEEPIPPGMTYLEGTAAGAGAEITFSSDGKTFAPPTQLTFEVTSASGKTEKKVVTPNEYTHIRWTLKEVPPGASGKVTFQVKVN